MPSCYAQAMEKIEKTRFRRPSGHDEPDSAPAGSMADGLLLPDYKRGEKNKRFFLLIRNLPLSRIEKLIPLMEAIMKEGGQKCSTITL